MKRLRRGVRLHLIAALGLWLGCDDFEEVDEATSTIEGEVHFLGPVPGVRVLLYRGEGVGTRPTYEAEAVTDDAGRYRFEGLTEPGDYVVVAELGEAPWRDPHTGAAGAYGPDLELRAPVEDLDHLETRVVQVTPLTTLLVAVAEALVPAGAEFPVREAHTGFNAWLTFDPVRTPIGEPRTGLIEARRHRLVLEGFAVLAARAADVAGVRAGTTLTAEHLLEALVRDALGPTPPARFDGRGDAGPIVIERGPGGYALSPRTVRGELADAVQERLRTNRWSTLTEADIADLLHSLRCTPAPFLQSCEGDGGEDRTPPGIGEPVPAPETPVAGVVVIEVTATDPETGIRSLTLHRLAGDGPPVPLDDRDDRLGVVNVVLDTTVFPGHQRLEFEARAENRDGVSATRRFGYPLANFRAGELVGHVVKGPAVAVEVRAHGLQADGGEVELARAFTDDAGAFQMTINEWRGPAFAFG